MRAALWYADTEKRFWSKVARSAPSDCWLWTAGKTPAGYGQFDLGHRHITYAHRYSYELHIGAIPDGLFVCHTCDRPSCCNPAHLFLGTAAENTADAKAKGRLRTPLAIANGLKTHCKHGHEFTPENTIWRPNGGRQCRACQEASNLRWRTAHPAAGPSPTAVNAGKTHCIHGHEFTPENTLMRADGGRTCLTCKRARGRNYQRARRHH